MSARRPPWAAGALTALAAIAVHGRTALFGFTGLDDRDLLVDDHAFLARPGAAFEAFGRAYMHVVDPAHGYYRPLVTASFAVDARWSGLHAAGYHATNVALHAAASVLLLALLRRLAMGPGVALAGALAFATTPAIASAVAWIPGRNDSLLAVFALAAWLLFARDAEAPSWRARALHFAALACAMLTKETAIALPLVCVAHATLVEGRAWAIPQHRARTAAYAVGWPAAMAAFFVVHARLAAPAGRPDVDGVRVLAASLGKVVFPFDPAVLASSADVAAWPGVVALAGIVAATRLVPGVRWRVVALGGAAFALLLAPVLALHGTLVLDCRLYLPAACAIVALAEIGRAAAAAAAAAPAAPSGGPGRDARLPAALAGVALVVLAAVTVAFESAFRDPRAFARQAVADSPRSPMAHFCLGRSLQEGGDAGRALAEYRAALELGPVEVAHNNIAVIYMAEARWAEAEAELEAELAINPGYGRAYSNLAIVLRREGRDEEAREAEARGEGTTSR